MTSKKSVRIGLIARLMILVLGVAGTAIALLAGGVSLLNSSPLSMAGYVFAALIPIAYLLVRYHLRPQIEMFRALEGTALSFRDGDYSFSLHWPRNDEIGDLVNCHNILGTVLREQRLALTQRELLLDTMVQNSPVAMLLVSGSGPIVFGNIAARQLLHDGRPLEGKSLEDILERASNALRDILQRGGDGIFTVHKENSEEDDIYFLARRQFSLNGKKHELLLLRHLTAELRRQEVQTWKQVIRVISHELNNSLAPIASLAASSAELVRRKQTERLPDLLRTIEDRTRHLESFIAGYARFAKLPIPRIETTTWPAFLKNLQTQVSFINLYAPPEGNVAFDVAQMEQALINVLKNAHESGSAPEAVTLGIKRIQDGWLIEVRDRGAGMSDTVLENALVPFYSTKRSGSGIGLALTREIVEAHRGRISIGNRRGSGLRVTLFMPDSPELPV
jgi:two-component system, NtrC family, nitrogen regulation sensor histidine kinase NtrY